MIAFRCWHCDKKYSYPEAKIGTRYQCACSRTIKVPKRTGGWSRSRTIGEWAIEIIVYGLGGGTLGFLVGILVGRSWQIIAGFTLFGLLVGTFGGERGINWLGRMIREREPR